MAGDFYSDVVPTGDAVKENPVADECLLAREQFELFNRAYMAGHSTWLKFAEKYDRFYVGDQWETDVKKKLDAEGRPALTINLVLSTINACLGEQMTSRLMVEFKNNKDASAEKATLLTKMAQAILAANQYAWIESQVYADGLILDRGYFDLRMDFKDPVRPNVRISCLDPGDVILPPEAKTWDINEWNEVMTTRWLSLEEISATYGEEYADKLKNLATTDGVSTYGRESMQFFENSFGENANVDLMTNIYQSKTGENRRVKSVRVLERQFRMLTRVYSIVDPATGTTRQLPPGTSRSDATAIAKNAKAFLMPSTVSKIRWRVTADRFVLHDEWSPYKTFTVIPYFPYFRRGKPFGMVANLISPQEQLNKLSSQELHVVNSTANSGWIVENGTLYGMTADELALVGSKSGLVIETNPGKRDGIKKIESNTIPTGLDRISSKARGYISVISGVNDSVLGTEGPEVSGVAIEKKKQSGQLQIAVPRDNLTRTQWMLGKKLLELMQDFMGYEQVVTYVEDGMAPTGTEQEQVTVNKAQPDGSVENDITTGEYDLVITTMPSRDTFNDVQFAEAIALRSAGVQIPDYRVIQYSNLQHKDQIAAEVKQLTGLGERTPEEIQAQQEIEAIQKRLQTAKAARDEGAAANAQAQAELAQVKAQEIPARVQLDVSALQQKDSTDRAGLRLRDQLMQTSQAGKLRDTLLKGQIQVGSQLLGHRLSPQTEKGTEND